MPATDKLVPIIMSHGLTASRHYYSVLSAELASYGYCVFVLDHHDGSCAYTKTQSGEVNFDTKAPFMDLDVM